MGNLPNMTSEYFQILVVRELRKVGFEVGDVRVHRRSELPEPEGGFVVELAVPLGRAAWRKRALVACRRQEGVAGRDVVESLKARLADARADVGILFSTADFDADAVTAARESHVALLRVVESRTVYDTSGWSTPGHYPAWLPAHTAQVVDQDASGQVRTRVLEMSRGGAELILEHLGPEQ